MTNETVPDVADLALMREILGDSPAARVLIELETLRAEKAAHAREVEALRQRWESAEALAAERLRTLNEILWQQDHERLTERAEAAEADARRYRWLRSNMLWCNGYDRNIRWAVEIPMAPPDAQVEGQKLHAPITYKLDKAIDAAIASGGEDRKA